MTDTRSGRFIRWRMVTEDPRDDNQAPRAIIELTRADKTLSVALDVDDAGLTVRVRGDRAGKVTLHVEPGLPDVSDSPDLHVEPDLPDLPEPVDPPRPEDDDAG